MYYESHFMVDFTLPEELTDEFFDLLPYQDSVVNKYLSNGKTGQLCTFPRKWQTLGDF